MLTAENSRRTTKSARLTDGMGRHRTRPLGEDTVLSFKVSDALVRALDAEALRLTADRGPGASKVSRSEMVKLILAKWLDARPKSRQ
jgi:hypothetical protein